MISILTMRRDSRRGLTLIEILIALIILMVGLVGIFALFPVGIKSTQESVEDTTAALIAESFHHALIAGMRASRPATGPADNVPVCFCHDGLPSPGKCGTPGAGNGSTSFDDTAGTIGAGSILPAETYVFVLPSQNDGPTTSNLHTYPRTNTGTSGVTSNNALFEMGTCGAAAPPYGYVQTCLVGTGNNQSTASPGTVWAEDPTESLTQYYVSFDVVRVKDQAGTFTQPLFEFQIGVYRNYQNRGVQGWPISDNPPGGAFWPPSSPMAPNGHPDRRKVFRTLIAGN